MRRPAQFVLRSTAQREKIAAMSTTTTNTLPTTLGEINACAASMFNDHAVRSVNVQATWGEVTVHRDGTITPGEAPAITSHPQAKATARLIQALIIAGYELKECDDGGEVIALGSHDLREAVHTITSVDIAELRIKHPQEFGRTRWLQLVLGNDDSEIVSDYSCIRGEGDDERLTATISAWSEAEAAR